MTPGRLRIRSCIPQKHPPARIAFSVFWLIALLPSSRRSRGAAKAERGRSSGYPAARSTLRRLRAFPTRTRPGRTASPTARLRLANSVRLVPGSWVVAEQRVDEQVEVAAAVEEGAAGCSLELESALVGDLPARGVPGRDHQRDAECPHRAPKPGLGVVAPEHRLVPVEHCWPPSPVPHTHRRRDRPSGPRPPSRPLTYRRSPLWSWLVDCHADCHDGRVESRARLACDSASP